MAKPGIGVPLVDPRGEQRGIQTAGRIGPRRQIADAQQQYGVPHQQRDQRPHAGECQQGQRVDPIRQIVAAAADGWIAGVLRPQQGDQRAGDQCEHG
ncbi:hypothetical protein G6F31_015771 [Rhizopus arrhizus]|nr:hypothetical protein G6F31_015771 [Rhizopus arrhizus]